MYKKIIKRILMFFAVMAVTFAIVNVVWLFAYKGKYDAVTEKLHKVDDGGSISYATEDNGYVIDVKMPEYLSFDGGFIRISDTEGYMEVYDVELGKVTEHSAPAVTMYVWPNTFGDYDYGIDIYGYETWVQIAVDSEGNCIPSEEGNLELDESNQRFLDEYREDIEKLFEVAEEYCK